MPTNKWNTNQMLDDLKKLDKWLFSKKTFIILFLISLIFILKPFLAQITNDYLVTDKTSSNSMMDFGVITIFSFLLVYGIYKFKLKYQPSSNHIIIILISLICYSVFRFGEHSFNYDRFVLSPLASFYYLDFIVFSLFIFPLINWFRSLISSLNSYKTKESESTNTYFEDRPIQNAEQSIHLVTEITDVICQNNFTGSFSIGIMGTWGHGKSTFLQAIKSKMKSDPRSKSIIEINFSPFLNHKEEEVITEFFKSFSVELGRYNGQLSRSLIQYAGSLTKLYKRGETAEILSNTSLISENPAYELYNTINNLIEKTGRKIVVYIDDLDRLSSKEILQIFKLIRNTSNFRNTFFVLALDKTYVVNALAADKSFMESNFIDKFFQLEVFLPEINNSELIAYFHDLLEKSKKIESNQIYALSKVIRNKETLFEDYIKNYRDCVRLANQIIFDSSVLNDLLTEVSVSDTLNLILFKTRFPQIFNELHQNRKRFLASKNEKYYLPTQSTKDKVSIGNTQEYIEHTDYSNYKIDEYIKANKSDYNLSMHERNLILKTLTSLFSNRNPGADSIMFIRNFNRLMRLRYARNDLRNFEFDKWFLSIYDRNEYITVTNQLLNDGKGPQLVDRTSSYEITSEIDFEIVLKGSLRLINDSKQHNLDSDILLNILSTLAKDYIPHFFDGKTIQLKKIILEEALKNVEYSTEERINILKHISTHDSWGFSENEISNLATGCFKEYLTKQHTFMWTLSDYTCYDHYHTLKEYTNKNNLNNVLIEFLNKNDISVFCAQTISPEYSSWFYYEVSGFIKELFEDYETFRKFVQAHRNASNKNIQEYLQFYELWSIANYTKYIKYIFEHLELRPDRKNFRGKNEASKSGIQIFIKFHKTIRDNNWHLISKNDELDFSQYPFEYQEDFFVLYNTYRVKSPIEFINFIFNQIFENIEVDSEIFKIETDEIGLTGQMTKYGLEMVRIHSVQYSKELTEENNTEK